MIADEEAVPYLDVDGHFLKQDGHVVYRRWCLTHWAARRGALPPSHPDFLRPIDPRTRAKDRKKLGARLSITQVNHPTAQPAPEPIVQLEHEPIFDPEPPHKQPREFDLSEMRLQQALEAGDHALAHALIQETNQIRNPMDILKNLSTNQRPQAIVVFPTFYPEIFPKVDFLDWIIPAAETITDATIVARLEAKNLNTLKMVHYLKAMGYKPPRIASAVSKGLAYVVQLLAQPAPDLRDAHAALNNTQVPELPTTDPSPEPMPESSHLYTVEEILAGYSKNSQT